MNDLVKKANSIEEDIKGMPILEQIQFAANLYKEMNEVRGDEMGDMNIFIKAQTNVECVWRCLAAEYKGSMIKELERRVAETSYEGQYIFRQSFVQRRRWIFTICLHLAEIMIKFAAVNR